jgi:hypothetical protein
MKARIKSTGDIIEVIAVGDYINENGQIIGEYKDTNGVLYTSYELDFYIEEGITIPDYWTRLEHQYAGMAMQGILSNPELFKATAKNAEKFGLIAPQAVAIDANCFVHALVEKMKEERK